MSLNKGKAKVKTKSKSIAKSAGKNKAAVMNTRSPKKPTAISGDTMSNYAMYKRGGKVSKIKKYQPGGRTAPPPIDDSMEGSRTYRNNPGDVNWTIGKSSPSPYGTSEGGAEVVRFGPDKYSGMKDKQKASYIRLMEKALKEGKPDEAKVYEDAAHLPYGARKKGGPIYKKGGVTKAKKFAALAPPYNKATAADRIAGAKKNARKK